jgi:P-type Cu+ transporter
VIKYEYAGGENVVQDPVCGMDIEEQSAFAMRSVDGTTYSFCSQDYVDKLDADLNKYIHPNSNVES